MPLRALELLRNTQLQRPHTFGNGCQRIKYIGAWDADTGEYLSEFYPSFLDARKGMGPWELTEDSNGCLWAGGDLKQGSWTGASFQWLGGFGKFCPATQLRHRFLRISW